MAQYDKLVERLKRRPPEADYEDVRRLLLAMGWSERSGTKHRAIFTHPVHRSITIPTVRGRTVKRVYVDQICKLLGLDD